MLHGSCSTRSALCPCRASSELSSHSEPISHSPINDGEASYAMELSATCDKQALMTASIDQRHQVFISSTYTDLIEERKAVTEVLLRMRCLPAGMEMFPASNEEQLQMIKRVIDDCDYYLVIVAARLGSLTEQGISYTESEYDYAVATGVPVLGFIHQSPETIAANRAEATPAARRKLEAFRTKVMNGRVVSFYSTPADLATKVSVAVAEARLTTPRDGWVRAKSALEQPATIDPVTWGLSKDPVAPITDVYRLEIDVSDTLHVFASEDDRHRSYIHVEYTWKDLFLELAPYYIGARGRNLPGFDLAKRAQAKQPELFTHEGSVTTRSLEQIDVQFAAQGLIKRIEQVDGQGSHYTRWTLTDAGFEIYSKLKAIRS
jgi:hypothetical protein